jgi:large subunit ribosomal protein L30
MKIRLIRSYIGKNPKQRANLKALGLRKLNQVKEVSDNPVVRGQINKVKHLIEVTE